MICNAPQEPAGRSRLPPSAHHQHVDLIVLHKLDNGLGWIPGVRRDLDRQPPLPNAGGYAIQIGCSLRDRVPFCLLNSCCGCGARPVGLGQRHYDSEQ